MLPLELLRVVFGVLSRADLEVLMLVKAVFRDVVIRDFATEPFRYYIQLQVQRGEYHFNYTTISADGTKRQQRYNCQDDEDFHRRMRFARIGALRYV